MSAQTFMPKGPEPMRPRPLNAITASARRLTTKKLNRRTFKEEEWQAEAWSMFDLVGEERFLASTLSNRLSQARFIVGRVPDVMSDEVEEVIALDTEEEPVTETVDIAPDAEGDGSAPTQDPEEDEGPIPAEVLTRVMEAFGSDPASRKQLIQRLALNLFVGGEGWLIGFPPEMIEALDDEDTSDASGLGAQPLDIATITEANGKEAIELTELAWRMFSTAEVAMAQEGGKVKITFEDEAKIEVSPDAIWMIRVRRPHPYKAWQADSPTRSSMPILRELVGLTMHTSALIDSRLAGAGVFIVPQSAQASIKMSAAALDEAEEDSDPMTDALIEAMTTPIQDRSSASAVVPLVITAPDDSVEKFKHISFASGLDKEASKQRDEAIRRLALGQDAPPELLLGMGTMNHWGAWLVKEDVVTTHLEPPLALISDALTRQYLWPILEALDYDEEDYKQYVVWYSVEHLIVRPNEASEAKEAFLAGAISAKAYRDAAGFDDMDAPTAELEEQAKAAEDNDEAKMRQAAGLKAIDLAIANPQLVVNPGLEAIAEQVYNVMRGDFQEEEPEPQPPTLQEAQDQPQDATDEEPVDETTSDPNQAPDAEQGMDPTPPAMASRRSDYQAVS